MEILKTPDKTKDSGHKTLICVGTIAGTVDTPAPELKVETSERVYKKADNTMK